MLIIPAIDLKEGNCLRIQRCIIDDSTVFSDHPVEIAEQWISQGVKRNHFHKTIRYLIADNQFKFL